MDAFKLYVGDDGEMKMGDHHNDFYSFSYGPANDADDLMNLQQQQLSANGGGGDFYADTENSAYDSSDSVFNHRNTYLSGGEAGYTHSETEGVMTERHSWAIEPALLSKVVSRRRRLLPKRRGGRGAGKGLGGGDDHTLRRGKKGRQRRHHPRARPTSEHLGCQDSREGGDGDTTRMMPPQSNLTLSHATSSLRRNGQRSNGTAPHARQVASVRPGAHVAAGAAAYPYLPASLGALVLLSPGTPTTSQIAKMARLRRRLVQRQREEQREYQKKQRARHTQQTTAEATSSAAAATTSAGDAATPQAPGSPRHANATNSHSVSATLRAPHPVTELKFSLEDLNRSMGPATARMGAGASLAILRSARQRVKESPRLQEVSLKGEAVYVRADPAAATAARRSKSGVRSGEGGDKASLSSSTAAAGGGGGATYRGAPRQPCELRDPYTGVVIPSSFAAAAAQDAPAMVLSCTSGIPFFHDPTAPRPIAVADVAQPPPLVASEANSSREVSVQTPFSAPLTPPTPTTTAYYTLPSSLQQLYGHAMLQSPVQQPQQWRSSAHSTSLQGSPQSSSVVPTVHSPPASSPGSGAVADAAAAQHDAKGMPVKSDARLIDDAAGRHARTETETYRDVRLALPHSSSEPSKRGLFLTCAAPQPNENPLRDLRAAAVATGEYRMPSAIAGDSGHRQRWRLYGGGASPVTVAGLGDADGGAASLAFHRNSSSSPPPWRWLRRPLPHSAPLSASSSASGGSHSGHQKASGSEAVSNHQSGLQGGSNPSAATVCPRAAEAPSVEGSAMHSASTSATTTQRLVFNLRGFTNACEANWAALRNTAPSPRRRNVFVAPQALPLYPSLVAPYAAPRYPLQQNIRFNSWTADGVSASTGATCVVHVFTITREMLRNVYEYVAFACAHRREQEALERERARQRRMRDALTAGVLTRDLQRCLRCPHCGVVGQITKVVPSRNAGTSQVQRSQPHAPTPRQLSQSLSQVRGMSNSQHGCPSLRVSASASSFSIESHRQQQLQLQMQQQPQTERGRHTALSSSERLSPQRSNVPPALLPHAPLAPSPGGSSVAHSSVVRHHLHQHHHNADVSVNDTVVTELAVHDVLHEAVVPAAVVEEGTATDPHGARPTATPAGTVKEECKDPLRETEGSASTVATSPPMLSGLTGQCSSLPPLPPTSHASQHPRLLTPTQRSAGSTTGDASVSLSSTFASPPPPPQQHQQQQQQQASAALASRYVPLGAVVATPTIGTATSPTAPAGTPNKRRLSPALTATTTADSTEGNLENPLEKSSGSRELSQSFVAPQPQRASNSQAEFQRYAASSLNTSSAGNALANALLSSDSQYNLSHPLLQRASEDREESSVRVESQVSDAVPPISFSHLINGCAGVNDDLGDDESHRCIAFNHSAPGPVQHGVMIPHQASCSSLPEVYMTPPTASLAHPDLTSPNQVELTLCEASNAASAAGAAVAAAAAAASAKRILSPSSTSSLPAATSVLPPHALFGAMSSSSTPPSVSTSRQATRPPPPPPAGATAASTVAGGGGSRAGGNGSFVGSALVSALTSAMPLLAPSGTSLAGEAGAYVSNNSIAQLRDQFSESTNAAVNRGSFALARRYVCQSCHHDVVPKTSMVSLAPQEDLLVSKSLSEAATPTLPLEKAVGSNNIPVYEPFSTLAFEDLLQDDALVQALQTYLQESVMLPATRPPRPSRSVLTDAIPETTAATSSVASANPRPMPSGSLFSDVDGMPKADMKSPKVPPAVSVPGACGGRGTTVANNASTTDAPRVRSSGAMPYSGNTVLPQSVLSDGAATVMERSMKEQWMSVSQPTTTTMPQVPMPSFTGLSSKSLSSSASPSSAVSSARSKAAVALPAAPHDEIAQAGERGGDTVSPAKDPSMRDSLRTTAAAPVPLLLRLCVPCCGLKISVLDATEPAAPPPPPPPLAPVRDASYAGTPSPSTGTATAAGNNASPKVPMLRKKSLGSNMSEGGNKRRMSRKSSCPLPTIPRMREDAATRGLTQSALFIKKEQLLPPSSSAARHDGRRETATDTRHGRASAADTTVTVNAPRGSWSRRVGGRTGTIVSGGTTRRGTAAAALGASQEFGSTSRTVMQDTDASKRHRVQVNSRMHLDATSIDRIWERLFTQDKSSAVAAVVAGRDKVRAKRLKSFVEEAAHTPSSKAKAADAAAEGAKSTLVSPHAGRGGSGRAELRSSAAGAAAADATSDSAASHTHQRLGIDLDAYADSNVVLKVELAYPRIPDGNVRQLLEEWVVACQPHPVLIEAVIRNIVYGVLTQLHMLHAAGCTSGSVKSTNVFPMWHLMKATKEAGMRMPPRAAAAAKVGPPVSGSKGEHDERFSASTHDADVLQAAQQTGETTAKDSGSRPTLQSVEASSALPRHSLMLSPVLIAEPSTRLLTRRTSKASPTLSITTAHSTGNFSMPWIHAAATLATPPLSAAVQPQRQQRQQQQQQHTPAVAAYRCTSTKAPQIAVAAPRTPHGVDSVSNFEVSHHGTISQGGREGIQYFPTARASTMFATAWTEQQRSEKRVHSSSPLTSTAPVMSDALASHGGSSGSGSGAFPFSPALGVTSPAMYRRGYGFSIDDSVIPAASRRRSSSDEAGGGGRRTRSAGAVSARRRHSSDSVCSRTREEGEDLVPLLVEVVVPAPMTAGDGAATANRSGLHRTNFSPQPYASCVAESAGSPRSRHSPPRRELNQSTRNSPPFVGRDVAAWAEGREGMCRRRLVRGAQLIPPARVLLPSLASCAGAGVAVAQGNDNGGGEPHYSKRNSFKAPSLLSPKEVELDNSDKEDGRSVKDDTYSLLTSGPTGAVPRPQSLRYGHIDSTASKNSVAAGRGSKNYTDRSGADGGALDPLQWSQQVMLVDHLGARVETALRQAMTTVLTSHPPCPARSSATHPTAVKDDADGCNGERRITSMSSARVRATSVLSTKAKERAQHRGDSLSAEKTNVPGSRAASPREKAAEAAAPPRPRSAAASAAADGEKSLNIYVPNLCTPTPPVQPVLFGIQESEYVPAPETIRSARDEAKALWRLWHQHQQHTSSSAPSHGGKSNSGDGVATSGEAEDAQMEYIVAQLAEQACPATTLRNTLDPYPHQTAAVDVWQLGMMALDLADGPVPTTWLKQREPTPRLNPYPWSSFFQSFVSCCLQSIPEKRATVAELLHHPWFRVALVPQIAGGGGERSVRDGRLQRDELALCAGASVLPPLPSRVSCVMGVDCLTQEEQAEWEGFDYTLLYADGDGMHPLTASSASPVSGVVSGISCLRRASASSPSVSPNVMGVERAGVPHVGSNGTATDLGAVSTGGDSAGVSQLLCAGVESNTNNLSGASLARGVAAANTNTSTNINGSVSAAMTSAVDAEFMAISSVDVAQYFTRLATLQWRRQQQQLCIPTAMAASLPGAGANRSGAGAEAGGGAPVTPDARGLGNMLLSASFFEHSLPLSADDVLGMLRQSSSNQRYLQLGSPRQNLYNIVSPRPPPQAVAAALGISQGQQMESAAPTPPLWAHPLNASVSATPYGLPSALSTTGTASPTPPAPLSASDATVKAVGLPPSYVPLRDPRIGGQAVAAFLPHTNGAKCAIAATSAAAGSSCFVSPRWATVANESSPGAAATATSYGVQPANSPPLFLPSAKDMRQRCSTAAVAGAATLAMETEGSHIHSEKYDPYWSDFSDDDRPKGGGEAGSGSTSSSNSSSSSSCGDFGSSNSNSNSNSESDDNVYGFEERSSFSGSSSSRAFGHADRAGRASSGAQSSSYSRSFMSSLDDPHLVHRGGGEVPYRRNSGMPQNDAEGSRAMAPALRLARDTEWHTSDAAGAVGDHAPLGVSAFVQSFPLTSAAAAAAGPAAAHGVRAFKPLQKARSMRPDSAGEERRSGARREGAARSRSRHLLFGTLATSLARLSAVVVSASESDGDESSSGEFTGSDNVEGHLNDLSGSFPEGDRTGSQQRTRNFCDTEWDESALHANNPITADAESRTTRCNSHTCTRSTFTPLSNLSPFTRAHNAARTLADEGEDGNDSSNDETDLQNSVEIQCDEMLRCFLALQRGCPMAVSLWCVRMLQQATMHPRTSAAAARLLERVERGVSGGAAAKNLAWLTSNSALSKAAGEDGANAPSTRNTVDATVLAAAAAVTSEASSSPTSQTLSPPPVLDTSPTTFHNYEMAKWLYAAHQTFSRCA
jgi:hypothetical protein